jgi:hypothetical protein
MEINKEKYLQHLEQQFMRVESRNLILLTRKWANAAPSQAGVYGFFESDGELVYGGETGNIRGRMNDLLNSMNHTFRRSVGERNFAHIPGYFKAHSKRKFPPQIEEMLEAFLQTNFKVAYLVVELGRKELEEKLIENMKFDRMFNKRRKRK